MQRWKRSSSACAPFLPNDVIALIKGEIDALLSDSRESLPLAIAGVIWSSSSAMTAVITTLNRACDIEEFPAVVDDAADPIGFAVTLAVFVVIVFGLVVGGSDLAGPLASWLSAGDLLQRIWAVMQWPVACLFVVFAIDLVYYLAPNAEAQWVWITPGSMLATVLWC
jgi:uncharacterized BrkB/YihY/UPF0761 family membrane protein